MARPDTAVRLYLIRHPRTVAAADVCYGSSDVAPLQAELDACLRALRGLAVLPVGLPIYSSPLQRCARLAHGLAEYWGGGPPVLDARLAEMHFGAWELRTWGEIPRQEVDDWAADMAAYRPGQGESVTDMARRVLAFREEILARGEDACVVCHAGTIRLLLAAEGRDSLQEIALAAAQSPTRVAYGQIIVLPAAPAGRK